MKGIKKHQKAVAVVMSTAMTLSAAMPAAAAEANTPKEEVVYVNLDAEGSVKEINVVNIFDLDDDAQIVDYGNYREVRNMNTTDEIRQEKETVKINASAGKLYYEGKLDSDQIPWNISVRYYMDGKEYSGDELAGKSGKLKIALHITENDGCRGDFFDRYALQASITLDTENYKHIVEEGAAIANVGSDKQLTYTILPGEGIETEITADVTDFEMDAISINGIPLSLDIDVDDDELMDKITELQDAIQELDDGAGDLKDGVSELQDSVKDDLKRGTEDLDDGAAQLRDGAGTLKDGGELVNTGAKFLDGGAASLDAGMKSLNQGIAQVQTGLDALNAQSGELTGGSAEMQAALGQLQAALQGVGDSGEEVQQLVAASGAILEGIEELKAGSDSLKQINYESYKAIMAANGVDVDTVKAGNTSAIGEINRLLESVDTIENVLLRFGISSAVIEPWKTKCTNLANEIKMLLAANNACIEGTEVYLNSASEKISELAAGALILRNNYTEFNYAVGNLAATLTGMMNHMTELKNAVNLLVEEYGTLDRGLNAYTDGVAQVVVGYQQVSRGSTTLVEGTVELRDGSSTLYQGTSELLKGIGKFCTATGTLKDGTGQLDDGVSELLTGIAKLYDGTGEMKDGTEEMWDETSGMDTEISDKIDELLASVTGSDVETVSFVSADNTNIESVQFVITTDAISIPDEEETEEAETENPGFWEKLTSLFKKS